ncbi:MAG: hypothetical protein E7552_05145 [Ruminococcaceae bacterium]|nr:hypothetical protein [Oscillospiraceae bacterium]
MRNILKRSVTVLLALAVLCSALLMTGCSTPKVAITVDGDDYTTGEYLAYLYNTFYQVYMQGSGGATPLYYYEMYSTDTDVWGQEYTHKEKKYDLAGYIKALTEESVVRQVAVKRMMAELGVSLNEEDKKALAEELAAMENDAFIDLGFNNESYARMAEECNYNESGLFYTLYGKGGQREVPETDVRKYFDDNYLSYMIISDSLLNAEGKDMTDDEKKAVKEAFEGYLAMYEKDKDFDAVLHKFEADEKAQSESASNQTAPTDSAPTTAATTTTVNNTTTESDATTTTADDHDHDHEEETETEEAHNHRVDVDSSNEGNDNLEKLIKEMAFNEVKILEYEDDNKTPTIALVLRMNPEADRGNDEDGNPVDYYAEQVEAILYSMKFEEFNKQIEEKMATLKVEVNDKAVKACDPYEFRKAFFGEQ